MVIGGSSGLGLEYAHECLLWGASRVIITARNEPKATAAMNALSHDQGIRTINPKAMLELFSRDLDDYDSASKFLQEVKMWVPELDVVLCNAGVNLFNYQTSKSGHEPVMQGASNNNGPIQASDPLELTSSSQLLLASLHRARLSPPAASHSCRSRLAEQSDIR